MKILINSILSKTLGDREIKKPLHIMLRWPITIPILSVEANCGHIIKEFDTFRYDSNAGMRGRPAANDSHDVSLRKGSTHNTDNQGTPIIDTAY